MKIMPKPLQTQNKNISSLYQDSASYTGETHYNPTDLPDFVIDNLLSLKTPTDVKYQGDNFTISESEKGQYGDLLLYYNHLKDQCNLRPPPFSEIVQALKEKRLRVFLKESVDPHCQYDISLRKTDDYMHPEKSSTSRITILPRPAMV